MSYRSVLTETQMESVEQKLPSLRWKLGKGLLMIGLFLVAATFTLEISFYLAFASGVSPPPSRIYLDFVHLGLLIGCLLTIVGFMAITSSPGNLSKDGVWSLQTGPLR